MWHLGACRCFGGISCYCHMGGEPQNNAVVAIFWTSGCQGGECLVQVVARLYTWKMRDCALVSCLCQETIPSVDPLSRITWLWDYTESPVGRWRKPALHLQLKGQGDFSGSRTVSHCLGLFPWRQKRDKRLSRQDSCATLPPLISGLHYSKRSWPLCMELYRL